MDTLTSIIMAKTRWKEKDYCLSCENAIRRNNINLNYWQVRNIIIKYLKEIKSKFKKLSKTEALRYLKEYLKYPHTSRSVTEYIEQQQKIGR